MNMALHDAKHRYCHNQSPRSPTSPTFEQLLQGDGSKLSCSSAPMIMRYRDPEEDHFTPHKKSVLAKVKERAKRWRHTLSKKRGSEEGNSTPSWGVTLDEDDIEEYAEYLGAPMYESELAPEDCKENARQHPRAHPVISEKHALPGSFKREGEQEKRSPISPGKTITETVTEKLGPAYATVSDATQAITSKIQSAPGYAINATHAIASTVQSAPAYATDATYAIASKIQSTPAYATDTTRAITSKIQKLTIGAPTADLGTNADAKAAVRRQKKSGDFKAAVSERGDAKAALSCLENSGDAKATVTRQGDAKATVSGQEKSGYAKAAVTRQEPTSPVGQMWDKGVSVTEYLKHKLEPGEDDKALSQVISEAISPRKTPADAGVVEKVREAVTNLLRHQEPTCTTTFHSASSSSAQIPISTNPCEVVEEENHGRILQTN